MTVISMEFVIAPGAPPTDQNILEVCWRPLHPPHTTNPGSVPACCLCNINIIKLMHFYRPQRSWGKVIFSEACVKNSVHGPTPGGEVGWGVCIPACTEADTPHTSRRLLLRVVRILLECILVIYFYWVTFRISSGRFMLHSLLMCSPWKRDDKHRRFLGCIQHQ